jgi:2',3'-cyclic-nucleotide 2'-phosphodiesterase (5'-nucleotidase family)
MINAGIPKTNVASNCSIHNDGKYCSEFCLFKSSPKHEEKPDVIDEFKNSEPPDSKENKKASFHKNKTQLVKAPVKQPAAASVDTEKVSSGKDNNNNNQIDDGEFTFSIFHTNDIHGKIDEKNGQGGLINLSGTINRLREETDNYILVDAGDISYNPPYSTRNRFNPLPEVLNEIGYNALAPGNHEYQWEADFHDGPEGNPNPHLVDNLKELSETLDFPVVNTNVVREDTGKLPDYIQPYTIEQVGDYKVGITGTCTHKMATTAHPEVADNWKVKSAAKSLKEVIPEMKENGADVVVVLAHDSLGRNRDLIKQVPGIDIMIGAHDHEITPSGEFKIEGHDDDPEEPNVEAVSTPDGREVPLVEAGSHTRLVGELEINIEPSTREIVSITSEMHPTVRAEEKADPDIVDIVNKWKDR